jgi:hypothetical protein
MMVRANDGASVKGKSAQLLSRIVKQRFLATATQLGEVWLG